MQTLLKEIDAWGYQEGIRSFLKHYPGLKDSLLEHRAADWVAHCLGKRNFRCLDIRSNFGNISEILSHIFQEVYSLETDIDKIEFQKIRHEHSNRSNIKIVRCNPIELPFPDNYFDLVVCNGMLGWVSLMNSNLPADKAHLLFLNEVKRVLSETGCLYIGARNSLRLPYSLGTKHHRGDANPLPDLAGDMVVGESGNRSTSQIVEYERPNSHEECSHTWTIWGYHSLLRKAGFRFKTCWVFPSYVRPYFSGKLDDHVALKGFVCYIKDTLSDRLPLKFRIILSLLEKMDSRVLAFLGKIFSPYFLLYCYKNDFVDSIDNIIASSTMLRNYTVLSKPTKIRYFLYDQTGRPTKIAFLRRYGYDLPTTLPVRDKTNPDSRLHNDRIWIEDWIPGKLLNPLEFDQAEKAIDWLIDFQNKTRATRMTKEDISSEVATLSADLSKVSFVNTPEYQKWLTDYKSYVGDLSIDKTAEHGDFLYLNILFDRGTDTIHVIDWDSFRERGNPFFDYAFFIMKAMQLPANPVYEFKLNLKGSGRFLPVLKKLNSKINNNFGVDLDLDILLRYAVLRGTVRMILERGQHDKSFMDYTKLLDVLSSERESGLRRWI